MQNEIQKQQLESTTAITSIETDPTSGTIITVTTNVHDNNSNSNNYSLQHSISRDIINPQTSPLKVDLYGWIFRPGDDGVVYITWISNLMQSKQSIPRLINYMTQHGCPPYIRRVAGKVTFEDFNNDTGNYRVIYIAKHEQQKKKNHRLWCTDIRFHLDRYPTGIQVTLTPPNGTRADLSSSMTSIRVYTTLQEMDGKEVMIDVAPSDTTMISLEERHQQPQFSCNGQPMVPRLSIGSTSTTTTTTNIQSLSPPLTTMTEVTAVASAATTNIPQSKIPQPPTPITAFSDNQSSRSSLTEERELSTPLMETPPQSAGIQASNNNKLNGNSNTSSSRDSSQQQQKEHENSIIAGHSNTSPKHNKELDHEQQTPSSSTPSSPTPSSPTPLPKHCIEDSEQQHHSSSISSIVNSNNHSQHSHKQRLSTPSYSSSTLSNNASVNRPSSPKNARLLHVVPEGYKLIPQHQVCNEIKNSYMHTSLPPLVNIYYMYTRY